MMLRLENVTVRRQDRLLLDGISLSLPAGAFTVIVGPNGAGKSTLLRVAAGLIRPERGTVRIDGQSPDTMPSMRLARSRAMLTQDHAIEARFTVQDVAAMGVVAPSSGRARLRRMVEVCLTETGLRGYEGRDVTTLSGGERQRAHLARVLVQLRWQGPRTLLLLDEPVSAQDIAHQMRVLSLAKAHAARGGACLAVLHDLNLAAACADRIVVLDRGRLHIEGTPAQILTQDMLSDVFSLEFSRPGIHRETMRPYILPHDLVSSPIVQAPKGTLPCISQ
ncbi:heme ABC transporter ATP-binding protein [Swaminathania salitolerans]|uniref:Hemin import ATP-binding protein HmuV n=1 Tax=Swaminathania salitolerans TaxID=182838 RepID=A0A511BUP5_9PROT|nr:heme ABC transporter ATP-binding protein [Swaminathania salitolerans]GBQ13938.1 ferrichrome transporter ATP-binding protein [Swaminathania salitolerans LMG 21291]GEL01688.1 hemin import ATP-binding protein HmuV [Swaminathania salitolerans]